MSDLLTSPDLALTLLAGLAAGGGVALFIASLVGWPRKVRTGPSSIQRVAAFARKRGAAAAITGLLVLALTRWPVAAIGTGLLVLFWTKLFGGKKEEQEALKRVEALAAWSESLRDTVSAAVGLEQAVQASARAAAPELRPHLLMLTDRLRAKTPLPRALEMLADDLADGDADVVIIALADGARRRGPGLSGVLGELAKTARENADKRRTILAQRAGTRRSVQIVVAVIVAFPIAMALFNPGYVEPYASVQGQGVLVLVAAFFLAGLAWLRRLSIVAAPARLLTRGESRG